MAPNRVESVEISHAPADFFYFVNQCFQALAPKFLLALEPTVLRIIFVLKGFYDEPIFKSTHKSDKRGKGDLSFPRAELLF